MVCECPPDTEDQCIPPHTVRHRPGVDKLHILFAIDLHALTARPHVGIAPLDLQPFRLIHQHRKALRQRAVRFHVLPVQSACAVKSPCAAHLADLAVIVPDPCQFIQHFSDLFFVCRTCHTLQHFHVGEHLGQVAQNIVQILLIDIVLVLRLQCKVFRLQHVNLIDDRTDLAVAAVPVQRVDPQHTDTDCHQN